MIHRSTWTAAGVPGRAAEIRKLVSRNMVWSVGSTPRLTGGLHPGLRVHVAGLHALLQASEGLQPLGSLGWQAGEDFLPGSLMGLGRNGIRRGGGFTDRFLQDPDGFAVEGPSMGGRAFLELRMKSRRDVLDEE